MNELETYLKESIKGFCRLISVEKSGDRNLAYYVDLSFRGDKSPLFTIKSIFLDKSQMREVLINQLINTKELNNDTSINEDILTEDQKERLKTLRESKYKSNRSSLLKSKTEWSNQFKVGDRVYYKGMHGIISFKHQMKNDYLPQEWSINCNDTEYRYVSGALLGKREVSDLSDRTIDKKLDNLTTDRLLKMYRRSLKVGKGIGNMKIKTILNTRENLNKANKIVNVR